MKYFWQGFTKLGGKPVRFKKHVIILYWSPKDDNGESARKSLSKTSLRYPSVKVKMVNIEKDPTKPIKHNVRSFPTVLLLKDGREVDRIGNLSNNMTMLEQLFRKAHV